MNSKERVLTTLNYAEPDRVPMVSSFTPEFASKLKKHFDLKDNLVNPHGGIEHDLELKLGNDILQTAQGFANSYYQNFDHEYTDEWNIKWKIIKYNTPYGPGKYTEIADNPLSKDDSIDTYFAPDPLDEKKYEFSKKLIKDYGSTHAIMGVIVCTIFETAWALRGLDRLLMDFVSNEEMANRILDIPFDYHLKAGLKLASMGVDIIWTGDDVGGQNSMMISPKTWKKYLKPRMATIFSELKKVNKDIKIAYHSDGYIYPIIDDLIEIGLDVLNPIQPKSMDPIYLKKRYGKTLSLWGTIDIQETLPFGTEQEVENEVKQRMQSLAPGGGFIISPTHNVQIDTPLENFFTFWKSVKKFGRYPINV